MSRRARASKIFGIGLSKTGTSSLARALEILGYRTKDYLGVEQYAPGDLSSIDLETIDAHDALTDTPIPSFYRQLDARYPGSKFILTVRERHAWLKSCKKQFTSRMAEKQSDAHNRLFEELYGTDVYDEQKFADGYDRFVSGVREYFKDRPDDILVIDIAGGEGWEQLCGFLGDPVPDVLFPKANVTQIRWVDIAEVISVAKMAGQETLRVFGRDASVGNPGCDPRMHPAGAADRPMKAYRWRVAKLVHALRGGEAYAVQRAVRRANSRIFTGLMKLTPEIPIVSRERATISDAERTRHNHLWLVDPIGGRRDLPGGVGASTVSISLVEDGRPIYGVVYAPESDTLYYARSGKGSFKVERGGLPQKLEPGGHPSHESASRAQAPPGSSTSGTGIGLSGENTEARGACDALAMCAVAEGKTPIYRCAVPTDEWEIAAAHAIANGAGKGVYECSSSEELKYNKDDMVTKCFTVR